MSSQQAYRLETALPALPHWAETWFHTLQSRNCAQPTLLRYVKDLQSVNLDLRTATLMEINERFKWLATARTQGSMRRITITVKQVLRQLDRGDVATRIPVPKKTKSHARLYTRQDIVTMLNACRNLRDRLLIELLAETGASHFELHNMRVKDVELDRYSTIIHLHGQDYEKKKRVYESTQDLLQYLEQHPNRTMPNAPFWITNKGNPLAYAGFHRQVSKISWKALRRNTSPRGFKELQVSLSLPATLRHRLEALQGHFSCSQNEMIELLTVKGLQYYVGESAKS